MSRVLPVSAEPEVTVHHWAIVDMPGVGCRLVGYRADSDEGRMTSPLVEIDVHGGEVTTGSGRRYLLRGPEDRASAARVVAAYSAKRGGLPAGTRFVDIAQVAIELAKPPARFS